MDSRTSRGCGVPPELDASLCCTAWTGVCVGVPTEKGGGGDATTRSEEGPFSGLAVEISSDIFKLSKEMRGWVELEAEMSADCNHKVSTAELDYEDRMTHVSHRTIPQLLGFADGSLTLTNALLIPIGFYAGFERFTCDKFFEDDVWCIAGSGASLRRRLGSVITLRREWRR